MAQRHGAAITTAAGTFQLSVQPASRAQWEAVAAAQQGDGSCVLRVKGLPPRATAEDVVAFFQVGLARKQPVPHCMRVHGCPGNGTQPLPPPPPPYHPTCLQGYQLKPGGVHVQPHSDSRHSKTALAEFGSAAEAVRALQQRDRQRLGGAYADRYCLLQLVGRAEADAELARFARGAAGGRPGTSSSTGGGAGGDTGSGSGTALGGGPASLAGPPSASFPGLPGDGMLGMTPQAAAAAAAGFMQLPLPLPPGMMLPPGYGLPPGMPPLPGGWPMVPPPGLPPFLAGGLPPMGLGPGMPPLPGASAGSAFAPWQVPVPPPVPGTAAARYMVQVRLAGVALWAVGNGKAACKLPAWPYLHAGPASAGCSVPSACAHAPPPTKLCPILHYPPAGPHHGPAGVPGPSLQPEQLRPHAPRPGQLLCSCHRRYRHRPRAQPAAAAVALGDERRQQRAGGAAVGRPRGRRRPAPRRPRRRRRAPQPCARRCCYSQWAQRGGGRWRRRRGRRGRGQRRQRRERPGVLLGRGV